MRSCLAALALLALAPACGDKPVDGDGFDTMPTTMDVPEPEPTACREVLTCLQADCGGNLHREEATCEAAEAAGEEPAAGCTDVAERIEACVAMCSAAVPESTPSDAALADDASSCAARVSTADDQQACDVLFDECEGL